jgi:hypothetical protein
MRSKGAALTALLVLAAGGSVVHAQSRSNGIAVSAFVAPHAQLTVLSQPAMLSVTAADIERGYIDVPAASRIEVRSNSRDGFMLAFDPLANMFSEVQISGLGAAVELGTEGGTVVQRTNSRQPVLLQLGYRFVLAGRLRPGSYAWPIALSARAL